MLRKRGNYSRKIDPFKVDEYNRFLISLDKMTQEQETLQEEIKGLKEKKEEKEKKTRILTRVVTPNKEDNLNKMCLKEKIDLVVKKIEDRYQKGDLDVHHMALPPQHRDPNEYQRPKFVTASSLLSSSSSSSSCCPTPYIPPPMRNKLLHQEKILQHIQEFASNEEKIDPPVIIIKETITIDTSIENIDDLLKLIDKHPVDDPTIAYNINMKSLHAIKEPLTELKNMVGMKDLKINIVDQILYFLQNLHKPPLDQSCASFTGDFMHTVIYGPPGTGKTEIAKIMGKVFSNLGVLNKGTFKKVTRSDLVAGFLGQTAMKTKDVVKEALGGVLFIDEAYALGNQEKRDSFAKECIDTLCEALSDHKDNLMVIIAGYEEELKECFFSYNQGLDSRFTWRFKTDQYTPQELFQIFEKKIVECGWSMDPSSPPTVDWFLKQKDYFKFFGRDVETLLAKTKIAHGRRVFCLPDSEKRKIAFQDLEKGFRMFLMNDEVKSRKQSSDMKTYLYHTMYS